MTMPFSTSAYMVPLSVVEGADAEAGAVPVAATTAEEAV